MFMLSHNFSIDEQILNKLNIKKEPLSIIAKRIADFTQAELKKMAESLRPFLFDEKDADLIINAHQIIPELLNKYQIKGK